MMSIDFLVTTLIVVVSPGTGVLYHAGDRPVARRARQRRRGLRLHARHRAAHGGGDHGPGGAAAHQRASPSRRFKYLGVAYLLYMAWMTLKEHGALKVEKQVGAKSAMQVIVTPS